MSTFPGKRATAPPPAPQCPLRGTSEPGDGSPGAGFWGGGSGVGGQVLALTPADTPTYCQAAHADAGAVRCGMVIAVDLWPCSPAQRLQGELEEVRDTWVAQVQTTGDVEVPQADPGQIRRSYQ